MDRETRTKFRAAIAANAAQACTHRSAAREFLTVWRADRAHTDAKMAYFTHDYKRRVVLRYETRYLLLAYAYARGVPYAALERKTNSKAHPYLIFHAFKTVTGVPLANDTIAAWLAGEPMSRPVAVSVESATP